MTNQTFSYYVVAIDYGRRGVEAIVDPEITRREVIARIKSGEYPADAISFIHHVTMNDAPRDVTEEFKESARYERAMTAMIEAMQAAG